jgi:hypothetical protein
MLLLTKSQLKRLSNIFDNAGQVLLGTLVIGPLISNTGIGKIVGTVSFGILVTVLLWFSSLTLERKSV